MARLIYHAPLLMGRSARYKVDRVRGNAFDITLTKRLSGYSNTFKMFPFSTKYGGVEIRADAGTAGNRVGKNGNSWVEYEGPSEGKKIVITYPVKVQAPPPDPIRRAAK